MYQIQREYIEKMMVNSVQLINLVKGESTYNEKNSLLTEISRAVYSFKDTIQEEEDNYDNKFLGWRKLENRMKRSQRLIDLGAPTIIIEHELDWLKTMIDHLEKIYQGIEPNLTEEQVRELREQAELEDSLGE